MYTPTMTPDEIRREYQKDMNYFSETWIPNKYANSPTCKIMRRAGYIFPASRSAVVVTPSKNKYIVSMQFLTRKDAIKCDPFMVCGAIVNEGRTYKVIVGNHGTNGFFIFSPHLISRYKERMGLDLNGDELIIHLLNGCGVIKSCTNYRGKDTDDFAIVMRDGCMFGKRTKENHTTIWDCRTFIANGTIQFGEKAEINDIQKYNKDLTLVDYFDIEQGIDKLSALYLRK